MFRIVLADDHGVVREGVARIIERAPDLTLVAEAATGTEAVAHVIAGRVDVCVVDLDMPGGGLGLVERLRDLKPDLRILVLSMHAEHEFALRALEAGAHGYLNKATDPATVEAAIRQVASGRRYLSEAGHELALDRVASASPDPASGPAVLTSRELEILIHLARGERVTDIADELGISFKTVSTYRARALEKLGLRNNVEIALFAREHGLI